MTRAKLRLRITLKSDMCPGSGDGFSSGIDRDVCYDQRGLPTIPGRRIKGCLKEAAALVGFKSIKEVFGIARSSVGGSIRVGDATLIACMQHADDNVQQTLDRYTMLRASTAIDEVEGSAKKNTLRFTRVIRQYVMGDSGYEELVFEAPVEVGPEYVDELIIAAKALRNMGIARNRGLGAVRCELKPCAVAGDSSDERGLDDNRFRGSEFMDGEKRMVAISYVLKLKTPVMIPRHNAMRSAGFVPGTSVYGFFASQLANNVDFERIFLRGGVRFSSLYPVTEEGDRCLLAPSFIIKVKGGSDDGKYKNGLEYTAPIGSTAKPLRDGFVNPHTWWPVDTKTEIVYHHSEEGTGELYTQQCLSAGQKLAGFIECPEELAQTIRAVLRAGKLTFGRSKSAQYSICIPEDSAVDFSGRHEFVRIVPGKKYAILLDADLLLLKQGHYTTDFEELKKSLLDAYGAWFGTVDVDESSTNDDNAQAHLATSIRTCTVSGYNAKWNQKKAHVQAFSAGSTMVFTVGQDVEEQDVRRVKYMGERQAEGFGCLRLISLDQVHVLDSVMTGVDDDMQHIRSATETECVRQRVIQNMEVPKKVNPSFVGRLALMVRESASEDKLTERIESIKDSDKRNLASAILKTVKLNVPIRSKWPLLQECLTLYLDLLKYRLKQDEASKEGVAL